MHHCSQKEQAASYVHDWMEEVIYSAWIWQEQHWGSLKRADFWDELLGKADQGERYGGMVEKGTAIKGTQEGEARR